MCSFKNLKFAIHAFSRSDIVGKRVLDVGSFAKSGSLRSIFTTLGCSEYVGLDLHEGIGVDVIGRAEKLVERFREESFDIVVSTGTVEHILDWKQTISQMKRVCMAGGIIHIMTVAPGYAAHGWPQDHWRWTFNDMYQIFADFNIKILEIDDEFGIYIKAHKPHNFKEGDLSQIELFRVGPPS